MAVMRLFSLFDRKLREHGHVLMERNDAGMMRSVATQISGSQSMVEKYPGDFDLYYLGDYDTETGKLTAAELPSLLENVSAILDQVRREQEGGM